MGRGSVFVFGLLALTNQGRVFAVGWVIIGLLFIGRTLGRVRKRRNSRHTSEVDSKVILMGHEIVKSL